MHALLTITASDLGHILTVYIGPLAVVLLVTDAGCQSANRLPNAGSVQHPRSKV
jgi:hypothetical protein